MLPCHLAWLIGLPAGVWAWKVLNRTDVRAAFQGKAFRARSHALARDGLVIAVGCLIGLLLIGAYLWPFADRAPDASPKTALPVKPIPDSIAITKCDAKSESDSTAPRRLDDGGEGA